MNKLKSFLLIISHLVLTHVSEAQISHAYSTVSLNVGVNQTCTKDEFQSPYTYKGLNPLVYASYERVKLKGQHNLDLIYSWGHIRSIVSPQANQKLITLNYDYFLNTKGKKPNQRFNASWGVGAHAFLSATNYIPRVEQSLTNYSANLYLTLNGLALYQLSNRSHIKLEGALPMVGVIYRPDFEINGKTLTKVTTLHERLLFSTSVEYAFRLSAKLSLTAEYHFKYFAFAEPRLLVNLQSSFSSGLKYKF